MNEDDNDDNNNDNDDNNEESSPLLQQLLAHLRGIAAEHGIADVREAIDVERARTILEVTGGHVLTAAQLYWDDFLARREQEQQEQQQANNNNDPDPPAREGEEEESSDDDDDDDDDGNNNNAGNAAAAAQPPPPQLPQPMIAEDVDDEPVPEINGDAAIARALRRRLFAETRSNARPEGQQGDDDDDDEQLDDQDNLDLALAEAGLSRRDLHHREDSDDDDDDEEEDNEGDEDAAAPEGQPGDRVVVGGSVNVSDDEGVWRWKRRRPATNSNNSKDEEGEPATKKRKLANDR